MILTVTMNPSIDIAYVVDSLVIDDVNRVVPRKTAGGKGLNVSRVLVQLGDEILATGLLGGHMGSYLADLMDADEIPHDFSPIEGETRSCVNLLHEGNQTELLESGPQVSAAELSTFTDKFEKLANQADCVVLSGSLPKGVPSRYYADLLEICVERLQVPVLLDTSGAALDAALECPWAPVLVKPNLTEINALLDTNYTSEQVNELAAALKQDERFAGIPWVVVSMGAAGSFAFHGDKIYRTVTPPIPAVNATGSGDSTIAGFAHAIAAGADDETLLKMGNTCGKLNAMDPKTGHLVIERWDEVYSSTMVTRLA